MVKIFIFVQEYKRWFFVNRESFIIFWFCFLIISCFGGVSVLLVMSVFYLEEEGEEFIIRILYFDFYRKRIIDKEWKKEK